jgi:hypothetical protein
MKLLIKFLIVLCLFGYGTIIQAQSIVAATGGNSEGFGGKVSYTVGQVVYMTITSTSGSVTQGVQQPYEISVKTSVEHATNIDLICSAYPNPSTDFLKLKIENYDSQDLSYLLYDIGGNLLENKKITASETIVHMSNFASGTYFLKVGKDGKEIKTFKIIKY